MRCSISGLVFRLGCSVLMLTSTCRACKRTERIWTGSLVKIRLPEFTQIRRTRQMSKKALTLLTMTLSHLLKSLDASVFFPFLLFFSRSSSLVVLILRWDHHYVIRNYTKHYQLLADH